ncbi:nuclear factor 7, ovary-like [Trichomycterus rosablanca]|uniref:nuclear factor 7, ovary-like n=1 Tax=Trichomycterus rosablanca TaxID=2290929 RepID=UPI002F356B5B
MSLKRVFSEEDFMCSVCRDIFADPVMLSCGHSTCRTCICRYWRTKVSRECPLCRTQSSDDPPTNLALRQLCSTYREVRGHPGAQCDLHGEELKLYCVEDKETVCESCLMSSRHLQHTLRPVREAAAEMKDVLNSALKPLTVKVKYIQDAKFTCEQNVDHVTHQADYVRDQITMEYKKLFQFLKDERKAMFTALKEEENQKTQSLKNKIQEMTKMRQSLLSSISMVRRELESEDVRVIKNFYTTLEKTQYTVSEPDVASTEVINVAQYLGNLQFKVWEKMQSIIKYTPVVLDPNTAHAQLVLSADLTSVRNTEDDSEDDYENMPVLDTPERFTRSLCVLASEGFSSGVHSWDVEVGNSTFWMIGVTKESVQRKRDSVFPSGVWAIGFDDENLYALSPSESNTPLPVATRPQVVRISLDIDAGEVWFLDPCSKVVVHVFSHHFTEKVFPFCHSLCSSSALRILPLQPFVDLRKLY